VRRAWLWLASAGCLLLVEPPPALDDSDSAIAEPQCDPDNCPGAFGCTNGVCAESCANEWVCKEGAVCVLGQCEVACMNKDCPDGLKCEEAPSNDCIDRCGSDDDCRIGRACCHGERFNVGLCSDEGACYERD
jgi:hypothetical protein